MKRLFGGSKCANFKEVQQMIEYLKEKQVYETVLEYRGSEHGWSHNDFHKRADNKGWTVTLFKILDGDCVGGFTTQSWHDRGGYLNLVRDDNAFLFNLSCAR
jgi:hypothetical protein